MWNVDWRAILIPGVPVLETILRGTLMYVTLFVFLRLTLRRVGGSFSLGDVLMVALVAAAAQNAMARNMTAVTDGVILVMTIVLWNMAFDWLGYRFPRFQGFYHPAPLLLVQEGVMLRHNMRRELITYDELMAHVHRAGLEDLSQVKAAYLEGDGGIAIVERTDSVGL
jgi:uncharacterized membrane protein YcaP (DUF421 family)